MCSRYSLIRAGAGRAVSSDTAAGLVGGRGRAARAVVPGGTWTSALSSGCTTDTIPARRTCFATGGGRRIHARAVVPCGALAGTRGCSEARGGAVVPCDQNERQIKYQNKYVKCCVGEVFVNGC